MPLSNGLSITQHPISSFRRSCRSLALWVPSRSRSGCFHGSPSPASRYRSTPATGPGLDSAVAKRSIIPDEGASSHRDGIPLRRIRISPDWSPAVNGGASLGPLQGKWCNKWCVARFNQGVLLVRIEHSPRGGNNVEQNPGCFHRYYRGTCSVRARGSGKRSKSQRHLALRTRAKRLRIGRANLHRRPVR
jgi:hypothetical protein